jgi:hypothetical protein
MAHPHDSVLPLGLQDPQQALIASLLVRIGALEARIAALERTPTVQVGSGAPTQTARDGTLYVDTTNSRLYARSAGVWKSALLS